MTRATSRFGTTLRHWRQRRGLSQLALATQAGTTSRHVSFLETGRSRPGRELALRLAAALDLPLRERNALLACAGLPPAFPERALAQPAMATLRYVLDAMLRGHEPYPAWVFHRGFQVVASNAAAEALFPGLAQMPPEAVVDAWFGPSPFRDFVENWREVVSAGLEALRRDVLRSPDPALLSLLRRAEAHAGACGVLGAEPAPDVPVACPRFRFGDRVVRTVSCVLRFDTAIEVTASELRVELLFPADAESAAFFREHARGAGGVA